MQIDKRWFLLLAVAVSSAVGAAVGWKSRRRNHGPANDREYVAELKSWENEGGNLEPARAPPVLP